MSEAEMIAARLYTGPMFAKYNLILRAKSNLPFFTARAAATCRESKYVTTLHSVNSAVVKLGKLTEATRVYRGISGGRMPAAFTRRAKGQVRGGIEYAFTSTTRERDVAMSYAATTHAVGGVLLEIQVGKWRSHPLLDTLLCTPSCTSPLVHTLLYTPSCSYPLVQTL
jgi:hypothetical protein